MASRYQLLRTWLLYVIAGAVITLAVLIGGLRLLVPLVPRYQEEIRRWASTATGYQIEFRVVSASWPWIGPGLSLYDVRVRDPVTAEVLLAARELSVGVNLWRLIGQGQPAVSRIGLRGAQLQAELDADGHAWLQGRPLQEWLRDRRPNAAPLDVDLDDIAVNYVDRRAHGSSLALRLEQTHAALSDTRIALEARVQLPADYGHPFTVTAELPSPPVITAEGITLPAAWKVGISGNDIDVVRLLDLTVGDHRPLHTARGALTLSAEFAGHRPQSVSVNTSLGGLRIGSGTAITSYERFAGRFAWVRAASGWDASVTGLTLRRGERTWPVSEAELHYVPRSESTPAQWRTRAKFLRLEDLYPLARALTAGTELGESLPQRVRGDIHDLDAVFAAEAGAPTRYSLRVIFDKLGYTDAKGAIAVDGISGSVAADGDGGRLQLDCKAAAFVLQDWFHEGLTADRLQGLMVWRSEATGMRFHSDDVRLQTAGIQISTRVELVVPADHSSPVIDLKATGSASQAREVLRYLPLKRFPPSVVGWLERAIVAGEVPEIGLEFRGPLREFPFDAGQGVFRVNLGLKGRDARLRQQLAARRAIHRPRDL